MDNAVGGISVRRFAVRARRRRDVRFSRPYTITGIPLRIAAGRAP